MVKLLPKYTKGFNTETKQNVDVTLVFQQCCCSALQLSPRTEKQPVDRVMKCSRRQLEELNTTFNHLLKFTGGLQAIASGQPMMPIYAPRSTVLVA